MTLSRFTDPSYFAERPWTEYLFVATMCLGQIITQSGTNNVLTHMYQVQKTFHAQDAMTPWYMASYGMSIGTLILMSGRVGDAYGLKNALIGGYAWTCVWSIIAGISYYDSSDGAKLYIAARAFQGAGVAFILPNAIGAAGRVYTPGTIRKKIVFGCIGLCAPWGGWVGTVMSGVIAVRTDRWDWNYYAMAIFSLVCIFLVIFSVPRIPAQFAEDGKRQDIDWIGSILVTASLTLFSFVWNQAPVDGWGNAYIIVLLAISVPMFGVFVWWELKMAKNPLLPSVVLTHKKIMAVLFILFLGWGAFGVNIYHYATLMQHYRHESPFVTGVGLTPVIVTGAVAAISCSLLISWKTVEIILMVAMMAFLSASLILCTAGREESYWRHTFGLWIVAPFGMDWSFPAGTIMLSEDMPPKFQGLAGSLVTVMVNYGTAVFLGIAGTVEDELLKRRPDDEWRSWRGSVYFSVGISGLACVCAACLLLAKLVGRESRQVGPGGSNAERAQSNHGDSSAIDLEKGGEKSAGDCPADRDSESVSVLSVE